MPGATKNGRMNTPRLAPSALRERGTALSVASRQFGIQPDARLPRANGGDGGAELGTRPYPAQSAPSCMIVRLRLLVAVAAVLAAGVLLSLGPVAGALAKSKRVEYQVSASSSVDESASVAFTFGGLWEAQAQVDMKPTQDSRVVELIRGGERHLSIGLNFSATGVGALYDPEGNPECFRVIHDQGVTGIGLKVRDKKKREKKEKKGLRVDWTIPDGFLSIVDSCDGAYTDYFPKPAHEKHSVRGHVGDDEIKIRGERTLTRTATDENGTATQKVDWAGSVILFKK
jgi:hypothetical protein